MKTHASSATRIILDWSKLLGFNQVAQQMAVTPGSSLSEPGLVRIGAKVGAKPTGHSSPR